MNLKRIAIFGAGGFGREVQMLIEQINQKELQFEVIGFFDDGVEKDTIINGLPVLGGINDLNKTDDIAVTIAVGNPIVKKNIVNKITNSTISFPTLIHPSVIMGNSAYLKIGTGCIICAGNIITTNILISDFVIINLACTVGHDSIIHNYCSFMPGVNISGEVEIMECVYIGTGAKIINQLTIGEESIIGAGSVVSKTIPAKCTAVGIPAKPIKFNN